MSMRPKGIAFVVLQVVAVLLIPIAACLAADVTYTYDTLNRLQQVDYSDGTRVEYQYDEVGNLTQRINSALLTVTKAGAGSGTVQSTPVGIDCGAECVKAFAPGTSVTLTAEPDPSSSTFGEWSGDCTGATCQLTMNTGKLVHASFGLKPAKKIGGTTVYFTTLQQAYDNASDGDTILSQAVLFTENLTANRSITVTLEGGYDGGFSTKTGTTSLKGTLRTTLGRTTVKNFRVQQ